MNELLDRHVIRRPVATWALMTLTVIPVLLLPDWFDPGTLRPLWALVTPGLLGLAGAVFAVAGRHLWWGAISAVWGFFLFWALIVVVALVGGP